MKRELPIEGREDEALHEALMEVALRPEISVLDQIKLEAGVLVPVLKALRAELGTERANELVVGALRESRSSAFQRFGDMIPGDPKGKWQAMNVAMAPRLGTDWDCEIVEGGQTESVENSKVFEMIGEDRETVDFNVTGCRFADFFRAIGEPELGAVLMCEVDDHMAEVGEVELNRTQTIMKGGTCCDFRFRP